MMLTAVIAVLVFGIWMSFLRPTQRGIFAGYPRAFSSVIHELFVRDFEQNPAALHVLCIGTGTDEPLLGLLVHSIALQPVYKDEEEKRYQEKMWHCIREYNSITLGQACYVALQGEDSPRVRYVLEMAEQLYAGSFESELSAKLDDLYSGDEQARELFARVKTYGLKRIEWRIPRETLLGSLAKSKMAEFYQKAAERGDPDAQFFLGVCYHVGEGVVKDPSQAIEWYQRAAEQGHASAQFNLGACYTRGEGVAKDFEKAIEWYRKAVEQGHARAQFNLGVCYARGEGVAKDFEKAIEWYRKAAEQGHVEARKNLEIAAASIHQDVDKEVPVVNDFESGADGCGGTASFEGRFGAQN